MYRYLYNFVEDIYFKKIKNLLECLFYSSFLFNEIDEDDVIFLELLEIFVVN